MHISETMTGAQRTRRATAAISLARIRVLLNGVSLRSVVGEATLRDMTTPRRTALLAALIMALVVPAGVAHAALHPGFIRSFPDLPGFTTPTQQQLADLAQTMLDPNADAGDNPGVTSGFTYFGQFLDHDLTLDTSPPPTGPVDPTTLANARTFAFDLDSVYGGGLDGNPELYDAAGRFRLATPNVNGVVDYVRRPDGSAIITDGRNDENRIISQIQVAIMLCHNRLIDAGLSFKSARQTLVDAYQEAVMTDFLPHLLSPTVDPRNVRELNPKKKGTPVEFSVAAYRFGHSQVRRAYVINEQSGKVQVFSTTAPDLRGGSPLPANRVIQWGEFFADIPIVDTDGNPINVSRRIDTLISSGLFVLPIP
ncbi:MAG TPA: peroxidase family protein, partial [Candidatus Limnocylindrales bacterium]